MNTAPTISIIGSGNMGSSLIGGLIANGHPVTKLCVSDPSNDKLKLMATQWGIKTTSDNAVAINDADVVIFAVKPDMLHAITLSLAPLIQKQKPLVMSVAAGVRASTLSTWVGNDIAIIRSMPNTPALIGCGATALYANAHVSASQRETAQAILRAVGLVVWVEEENLMDAITALSGSGPAYFFLMMESLQQAGENLGLPHDIARILTLQTAYGAARMALESKESLTELRKRVTSPGGTTEKALQVLTDSNLATIFQSALDAAKNRSEELANQLAEQS